MCEVVEVKRQMVDEGQMMKEVEKNIFSVQSNIYCKAALVYQSKLKLDKA